MKTDTIMPYKAIIFDLDGTLLDTLEDIGDAVNRVLAERGFPTHPLDVFRYFTGDGSAMLIRRALPENRRDDKTVAECFQAFLDDYGKNWNVKTKTYAGIPEMLDGVTTWGLKMAILSNKPHVFVEQCVHAMLSDWRFEMVWGQRDPAPKKPDPASALEIAKKLQIPPQHFLFLGDSAVDIKTAISASMFPVGALWGFRTEEELRKSGAKAIVSRPQQVMDLLDARSNRK